MHIKCGEKGSERLTLKWSHHAERRPGLLLWENENLLSAVELMQPVTVNFPRVCPCGLFLCHIPATGLSAPTVSRTIYIIKTPRLMPAPSAYLPSSRELRYPHWGSMEAGGDGMDLRSGRYHFQPWLCYSLSNLGWTAAPLSLSLLTCEMNIIPLLS